MSQAASGIQAISLREQREDLAAVFRWTARLGMHESVANHFSLAVGDSGSPQFLINPNGRHFANMRASDLLLLSADDPACGEGGKVDATAWAIHSAIHRNVPGARCILHLHPLYATALATLEDSSLPPVDQNAMRFFNRFTIDKGFDGMGLGDEAERLSVLLSEHPVLLMGNHGVTTVGASVAVAFSHMYYFERACRNYITALSTGLPLHVVADDVAEKTAVQWQDFIQVLADAHLREMREILDREEPGYRD